VRNPHVQTEPSIRMVVAKQLLLIEQVQVRRALSSKVAALTVDPNGRSQPTLAHRASASA
jgi:hypothetical protein